jgi:hypothetical protein
MKRRADELEGFFYFFFFFFFFFFFEQTIHIQEDNASASRQKVVDVQEIVASSPARVTHDAEVLAALRIRKTQGVPSPLRMVGVALPEDAKVANSPTSRGAQLLKMAQKREDGSLSRFSISAVQQCAESPSKNSLLDPRRSLFAPPSSPSRPVLQRRSPFASPGRMPAVSPSRMAPQVLSLLPVAAEELYEEFGVVDLLLGLAQQRGEACWWEDISRSAGTMRGENALSILTLEKVESVMPGVWKWAWERRDDRQLLHLRLMNGTVATEAGLVARRAQFRESLLAFSTLKHEEFLLERAELGAPTPGWHPSFVLRIELTPLPPRPIVTTPAATTSARLGFSEAVPTQEDLLEASVNIPASLAHLPKHVVVEARLREELAVKQATPAARLVNSLPGLCESLRSICVVNKRYIWPIVVLCSKIAPANTIHRPGVKEELRAQLEELGRLTDGYVDVFENTHADKGTFVKIEKKGFAEALAKLQAATKNAQG